MHILNLSFLFWMRIISVLLDLLCSNYGLFPSSAPFSVPQVRFGSTWEYNAGHIQAPIPALLLSQLYFNYGASRRGFRSLLLCSSASLKVGFEAETGCERERLRERPKVSRLVGCHFSPSRVIIIQLSTSVVKTLDNIIISRPSISIFAIM